MTPASVKDRVERALLLKFASQTPRFDERKVNWIAADPDKSKKKARMGFEPITFKAVAKLSQN